MSYQHRASSPQMTEAQASQLTVAYGAEFRAQKDGVAWWKLPDGTFLGVKKLGGGMAEVRRVSADACGCS